MKQNIKVGEIIYSDYPGDDQYRNSVWRGLKVVKRVDNDGITIDSNIGEGKIFWDNVHKLPIQDKRFFALIEYWKDLDKKMINAIDKFIKEVKVLKGI